MRGPGFREVSKLATCKDCGDSQLAWLQSAKGKWILCKAYMADRQLVANLMEPHYKYCSKKARGIQ
jgi:hypothetical protein